MPLALTAATTPVTMASAAGVRGHSQRPPRRPRPARPHNPDNPLKAAPGVSTRARPTRPGSPTSRPPAPTRTLLGKIALRPRATWFGAWTKDSDIAAKVNKYVANMSGGDPNVLVQMSVFRMKPWEHNACDRLPTAAEQASYKTWINRFAGAVGAQHTAIILQPDGPFALCAPGGSKLPSQLIGYAARTFSALPNTAVYIDAGASDWPSNDPKKAADILMPASIQDVRGFALNATHYTSTGDNIAFGTQVVTELAHRGVPGKHFIINTAQNGKPFTWSQKRTDNFDNSPVCRSKADNRCVTLGIPPTTNVANASWHLSETNLDRAAKHVDGYVWFGRPWLYMQADPFVKSRALQLVRTSAVLSPRADVVRRQRSRCSRRAWSSCDITSAGSRPTAGPIRSRLTDLTCSAWAFESRGRPASVAGEQRLERVDPVDVARDRDDGHDASTEPLDGGVGTVIADDHRRSSFVGLAATDRLEVDQPDLTAEHPEARRRLRPSQAADSPDAVPVLPGRGVVLLQVARSRRSPDGLLDAADREDSPALRANSSSTGRRPRGADTELHTAMLLR